MSHPDEGMIHAWLDGELGVDEAAAMSRRVGVDPVFAAAVAEARGLIAASSRIVGALDAVPGRVIPAGGLAAPALARRGNRGFRVERWMGIAAALVLTAGTAIVAWPTGEAEVVAIAQPPLAPTAVADVPTSVGPVPAPPPVASVGEQVSGSRQASSQRAEVAERDATERVAAPAAPPAAALPAAAMSSAAPSPAGALRAPVVAKEMAFQARSDDQALADVVVTGISDAAAGAAAGRSAPLTSTAGLERRSAQRERMAESSLSGCWRIAPPVPGVSITLLRDPRIVNRRGDTLSLLIAVQRQVTVVQRGDTLRGAELNATRAECPLTTPPEPE